MLLHHYSPSDRLELENIRFNRSSPFKPGGLWLSDDSRGYGWAWWCAAEEFQMQKLRFRYAVNVDVSDFLVLDAPEKVIETTERYSAYRVDKIGGREYGHWEMDWKGVVRDWSGILCSPYEKIWDDLEKNLWWSTIDCDSACVWSRKAILSVGKPELTGIPVREDFRDKLLKKNQSRLKM